MKAKVRMLLIKVAINLPYHIKMYQAHKITTRSLKYRDYQQCLANFMGHPLNSLLKSQFQDRRKA